MELDASFYADRFRRLAERFIDSPASSTVANAIGELDLLAIAGNIFLEAVDRGCFHSIAGTREIADEYRRAVTERESDDLVGFVAGKCARFEFWPLGLRRCPAPTNLFIDVAGDDQIEVFNENGKCRPTRPLPPLGLLPERFPNLFPAGHHLMMLASGNCDTEAAELERLAQAEATDRYALACQILANVIDAEAAAPPSGDTATSHSGGNSSPGSAAEKILGALLSHHKYDSRGCLNFDPIRGNELARIAEVGKGSVTNFWKENFRDGDRPGSYNAYCYSCTNSRLPMIFALLNGDVPPDDVLQGFEEDILRKLKRE